jgi:hypothetical protein
MGSDQKELAIDDNPFIDVLEVWGPVTIEKDHSCFLWEVEDAVEMRKLLKKRRK